MLGSVLRDLFHRSSKNSPPRSGGDRRRVLNVGGYSKTIAIPTHYAGWEHVLLDVDPRSGADIICDARRLDTLPPSQFDAVYCSHNLEHYYAHDVPKVVEGFHRVLRPDGFAEIKVPDIEALVEHLVRYKMGLDDLLYTSPLGPVTALDVLYGYGKEIEESGNDFWAHKTGFSPRRLEQTLARAGFGTIRLTQSKEHVEIRALAFKVVPTASHTVIQGIG